MVMLSLAFLYYKEILQTFKILKITWNIFQALTSNRQSLSHALRGWPQYLFGTKHEYGFGSRSTAQEIALQNINRLYNHTVIITGGNSGIGYSLCTAFCEVSHNQSEAIHVKKSLGTPCCIIMASRNETKSQEAIKQILKRFPKAKIRYIKLDLGKLQSILSFIRELKQLPLDIQNNIKILINNAGVAFLTKSQSVRFDDNLDRRFEKTFAVNYLGPFVLTQLVYDNYLKKNDEVCRIVNHSSTMHSAASVYSEEDFPSMDKIELYHLDKKYAHAMSYAFSKLFNIIHAKMMAHEYKQHNVLINACHPGSSIHTGLLEQPPLLSLIQKLMWLFFKTNDECAATSMLLACHLEIQSNGICGGYFQDCGVTESSSHSKHKGITNNLKEYSLSIYNQIK